MRLLALLAVSGCTWVSDAQYDDRVKELEEARQDFLPATDEVQFLTAAGNKVFWVDKKPPAEKLVLRALDTAMPNAMPVEIQLGEHFNTAEDFAEEFRFSDTTVIECSSGINAWDANTGAVLGARISSMEGVNDFCGLDGRTITTVFEPSDPGNTRFVYQWTAGSTPVRGLNLTALQVGDGSSAGLVVRSGHLLYTEAGNVWHVDISAGTATWLENDDLPASGPFVVDAVGAMYDTSEGVKYERFDDLVIQSFDQLVANGGYRLNSKHPEIHVLADNGSYAFHKRYVIYRGESGIFAYNLDTKKVTDLLLDRTDDTASYRRAAMTDNGVLFVQHRGDSFSSEDQPVYRVDVSARLP